MKKIFAFAAFLAVGIPAVSGQSAQEDASKLIECTNSVIDIYNQFHNSFSSYRFYIENVEKAYEKYASGYDGTSRVSISGNPQQFVMPGLMKNYENALAAVPDGVEGKEAVKQAVDHAFAMKESLERWGFATKEYFEQKKFVDDEFAGFEPHYDSLVHYYNALVDGWNEAVQVASREGGKAELILLADSPKAQFVIPMKTDLETFRVLLDEVFEMDEEDYDYAPYIERNNALQASIETNRSVEGKDTSVLKDGVADYVSFYSHLENASKALGNFMAELSKEEPNMNHVNSHVNSINNYYTFMIQSYNRF